MPSHTIVAGMSQGCKLHTNSQCGGRQRDLRFSCQKSRMTFQMGTRISILERSQNHHWKAASISPHWRKLVYTDKESPAMSHGVFGSLFSKNDAQVPPVAVSLEEPSESTYGAEADRSFEYALDALPCNAMFCDRELILRFLNRSSRK